MSQRLPDVFADSPLTWLMVVGLAGIVVWHLIPRASVYTRLVVQIFFFAAMTAILLNGDIAPNTFEGYGTDEARSLNVILAKSLWWLHLSWAVIGFVRIYLVLEGRPREARLLQDIVVGLVYLCVALSVLAFVFGVPIGTLVATSGVVAIVLGLALQNTLGDVFSGIALTIGRPYSLGDWILLADGTEGRVIASTWRSTHILTGASNIAILPNSLLAKLALTNVSQPDETHLVTMAFRVAPTRMPSIVEEVMRSVLAGCNTIVREPPPLVALKGVDATALEIELQFRVTSPSVRTKARNEVIDLFYRHCKSAGLLLATPPAAAALTAALPTEETARPPEVAPVDLIRAIPIFSGLTTPEKENLAETTVIREFHKGDVIVQKGKMLPSLMMIRTGIVVMREEEQELKRLSPGDFFGETGLLAGMEEAFTLEALTRVTVYEIGQQAFAPLFAARPDLAEEIAAHLSQRTGHLPHHALPAERERSARTILNAMRTIFRR
jgi:small-conductance mechanosensitive channel